MTALLALPFSGGAFTFILSAFSSQPAIQSFDDDGMTFTFSFTGKFYCGVSSLSSTRRQFSSCSSTSCFAQRENSFLVITPDERRLAPATTL